MKPSHTPTPWHVEYDETIVDRNCMPLILKSGTQDGVQVNAELAKANAAYIVKCVNAHERMVQTLKKAHQLNSDLFRTMDETHYYRDELHDLIRILRKTIVQAEGKGS